MRTLSGGYNNDSICTCAKYTLKRIGERFGYSEKGHFLHNLSCKLKFGPILKLTLFPCTRNFTPIAQYRSLAYLNINHVLLSRVLKHRSRILDIIKSRKYSFDHTKINPVVVVCSRMRSSKGIVLTLTLTKCVL